MYFSKKNIEDEPIIEDTTVFSCTSSECNCWMREDFASHDLFCPICGNHLKKEVRELPRIKN
ncbi:PHP family Zn ribbon phosphoesterase [Oikeobacillus pervagus]|uniref:PHP family Zn ribbon phosphoesterase n=1 Tax=Oikeobacillus pervagus TaxID=1325931 RepID=A0AAJ1WKV4_9BACI|nr:cold-inducible protein YdjO-related protein [Oikeobacillus pervagus]MDQ0215536.1 PHP family Zn ribbon phosphoesterase [Oikeobacillus pervagus]